MPPPKPASTPTVLYMDDEQGNRQAFAAMFRKDFNVLCAANLSEFWDTLEKNLGHVIIADQRMPDISGSKVLALARQRYPFVRRMLATAYTVLPALIEALNEGGASHYFQKPWEPELLRKVVFAAHQELLNEAAREEFHARIILSNQQLEFALRQRLMS